jgi:hypothetical protein
VLRFLLIFAALLPLFADAVGLDAVKAEPNLEKRSELALAYASTSVDEARKLYRDGKIDEFRSGLTSIKEATDLSVQSLEDTGKAARKKPKYFKRAEMKLRGIMKQLEGLAQEVSFDDRTAVEETRKHVSDLHDKVLLAIMTKK